MSQNLAGAVASFVKDPSQVNVTRTCTELGVSRKTFYKYVHRFKSRGVEGFFPDSRAPKTSRPVFDTGCEDVLITIRKAEQGAGWDYGADAVLMRLEESPALWPAGVRLPTRATINRILEARGFLDKVPQRKPRTRYRRFERAKPNELWQLDGFEYVLSTGIKVVVLHINDDCSRTDLALRAGPSENSADTWLTFCDAAAAYGLPAALLTDNGTAFSGRRRGWSSDLENKAFALGIQTICSTPNHPQTCGKNERAHQRVRKWLSKRPTAATLNELQGLLDTYRTAYNDRRNQVLAKLTPNQRFTLGPLAFPDRGLTQRTHLTHPMVSASGGIGVDDALIGVGRKHAAKTATVFRTGDLATIFIDDQMVREIIINRDKHYQPQNQ